MGEILPDGRIQGYTCAACGGECNMQGTGHGPGKCVPDRCAVCGGLWHPGTTDHARCTSSGYEGL